MQKKYAVISTDNNKEYANLVPLACYSWIKLGYTPIVIDVYDEKTLERGSKYFIKYLPKGSIIEPIYTEPAIRTASMAQISRLFVSCLANYINDDDIIVTSDSDMVIAKDIFFHEGDIVSYGWDLTGRGDLPICYIKATKKKWFELMQTKENFIQEEILDAVSKNVYSQDWNLYWDEDQKLLSKRANEYGMDKIMFIDRGTDPTNHGLPKGRWDRYKWENIPDVIVDVHMKRNDLDAQVKVFETLWPNDDIAWLKEFHEQLK